MALPGPFRSLSALGLAAVVLVVGCGPTSKLLRSEIRKDGAGVYVEAVPFVRQRRAWCGPAALASVAQHYGIALTQKQIASEVYLPSIGATLTIDLARAARRHGLWCHSGRGSARDVRTWLHRGVPVIALVKQRSPLGTSLHYLVLTGYHERRGYLIAHTGILPNRPLSLDRFAREHSDAGGWLLAACPPDRVDWPLDPKGHNDLGLLFEREGKLGRAQAEYERAIAAEPANPLFHFNLGNVLARAADRPAAQSAYRKAIGLRPAFADAHNNLACLLLDMGHRHQALSAARRAVTIDGPRVASYLDTLGRAQLALGRHAPAVEAFRQAIDEAGSDADILADARLGLIQALVGSGKHTQAIAEKNRLLASTTDPTLHQRAERLLR